MFFITYHLDFYNKGKMVVFHKAFEALHDKINKMACARSKYSDQHGHLQILSSVWLFARAQCVALTGPMLSKRL